ncbi:MAG: LysM peptidoglycan-binding domain-containing protein [Desulfobacteraceae bacterium]
MKVLRLLFHSILAITLLCSCSHLFATQRAEKNHPSKALNPDTAAQTIWSDADSMTYPQADADSGPDVANDTEVSENLSEDGSPLQAKNEEADDRNGQSSLDEALDFCEVAQSFWQKGELENALDALDRAYSLILNVDTREDVKLIQQKEDLRFMISKRILEIYASRNIVVNGNHDEIPLELNRHVEAELKRFTGFEKQFFKQSYARSGKYRSYILEALHKAGLPEELSWLPLIESGFKVKAFSRARALGLWQFIPSTGYKFGLKRSRYIDERIDFIKSTDAAIAYLKELHSIFGDWATVLAAYNCGEGRVLKVIRTQNVNYLDNFWDLYQRLPRETARYVPRFFATLHIIKNPQKYGFEDLTADTPIEFDTMEINRQVHLKDIARTLGTDLKELEALNPELRYHLVPPEPYELRLPKGSTETLTAALDTLPVSHLPQRAYVYHRVRRGQTLSTIARRYRTNIRSIMRANNMRRTLIRVGQRLKIPQRGYRTVARVSTRRATTPASGNHYVRKGDSLWIIARRYGTTVQEIKSLNHMRSNNLVIGQVLKIPGFKTDPLPDTTKLSVYSVKNGDSPYTIAAKHNMALERLLTINRLTPRSKIYPGQKLYIE